MVNKKFSFLWFLLGVGGQLQVVASLSISECLVLLTTPFLVFKEYPIMKRHGISTLFFLSISVVIGCIIASLVNNTEKEFVLRGLAVTCLVSASVVFSHWLIRNDPASFKWIFVGGAISGVLCTFIFKKSVEETMLGSATEDIVAGPLFWISRVGAFIAIFTKGWYSQIPQLVVVLLAIGMALFSILLSSSGRSAALGFIGCAMLAIIGGKTRRSISKISKHFTLIAMGAIILVGLAHIGYRVAATKGLLGDEAYNKYMMQTQGQTGIMRLLIGGRGDSFMGLLACRDKPIIGWGPWAEDKNGYMEEFMVKYGTLEDVIKFSEQQRAQNRVSNDKRLLIHGHSHITGFWLWYGVFGLIFMLYVVFVVLRFLKQDVAAVPQWFGWLACSIPSLLWDIAFSPFQNRIGLPLFVVACLMARAIRKGWFRLPRNMIDEAERLERR